MALQKVSFEARFQEIKEATPNKFVKKPEQLLALQLASKLDDKAHLDWYMRLCQVVDEKVINQALAFVIDSQTNTKGKLFMWKVKQLRAELKTQGKLVEKKLPPRPRKKKRIKPESLFDET